MCWSSRYDGSCEDEESCESCGGLLGELVGGICCCRRMAWSYSLMRAMMRSDD